MKIQKQSVHSLFIFFFSILFLSSCVSNTALFKQVDSHVLHSEYQNALDLLEEKEDVFYTHKDLVLKSLDRGILYHYIGNYEKSNRELSNAENLIFEYFSKSISQSIQSFIINDTVIDYSGDPYEDIYTNIFMALNYIALGEIDEAMVEIRRFDTKLKNMASEYNKAQNIANESAKTDAYFDEMSFHNSALARYLSMLLYRADGNMDAAEIDLRYLKTAFRDQSQLYPFSLPTSLDEELNHYANLVRLNLLAFTGLAPIKHEEVIRFYSDESYFKLAVPIMIKRKSNTARVDVDVVEVETGEQFHFRLDPLEYLDSIAYDTFKQKQNLLYFKAVARATAKSITTGVLDSVSKNNAAGNIFELLTIASIISNEITEVADLRTSRYFPAKALVGGIHIPPGIYNLKIAFVNEWGTILEVKNVYNYELDKNKLHLVEAICLQ